MFCDNTFADFTRGQLFQEWFAAQSVGLLLEMGERLHCRGPLLSGIFQCVKRLFTNKGRDVVGKYEPTASDLCETVLQRPAFLVEILALEEADGFNFQEFQDSRKTFAVGILLWTVGKNLPRRDIRIIGRLLGGAYLHEKCLREVLLSRVGSRTNRAPIEAEMRDILRSVKNEIRDCHLQAVIGNLSPECQRVCRLDVDAWAWKAVACRDVHTVDTATSGPVGICVSCSPTRGEEECIFLEVTEENEDKDERTFLIRKLRTGVTFSPTAKPSLQNFFENNVTQRGRIFCSGESRTASPTLPVLRQLRVLEVLLHRDVSSGFSLREVGRARVPGPVRGCQVLLAADGRLHGFTCYQLSGRSKLYTVSHFATDPDPDGPQEPKRLELKPLLEDMDAELCPIAVAHSTRAKLAVVFLYEGRCPWLAHYDPTTNLLGPLGFLPDLPSRSWWRRGCV